MNQHAPERTVLTATWESGTAGHLTYAGTRVPCAFGRSGVVASKREGDGATPLGAFRLRSCYWRPDRGPRPITGLPTIPIRRDFGWCDDPAHPLYNRPVRLPFAASRERLWRDDHAYDVLVTLDHNADPPVPGAGSAVFWHLTKTRGGPLTHTEGCVATEETAMREILARCGPGARLLITTSLRSSAG